MASIKEESGVDIFGADKATLEDIAKLSNYVNSSEFRQLQFTEELKENDGNAFAKGLGLFILGNFDQAAEALASKAKCPTSLMCLGKSLRNTGQYDKAVAAFDKAAKAGLDALKVSLEKAETLRCAGELDKAQEELKACSNFENVSADYHFALGRVKDAMGLYGKAIADYQTAAELDPEHSQALFHLAYACDLRGDEDASVDYYKQAVKTSPAHVSSLLNLAVLYEDMCQYEKAEECVYMVLENFPNHKRARLFANDIQSSKTMLYDEEKAKKRSLRNQTLEIPISDFELSVRSRNCLKKMNINTLGDLLRITEPELLSYKNFGETSLVEIKKILNDKSLTLGMALEDEGAANMINESSQFDSADEALLKKSVDEMGLSVRANRCLVKLGTATIGELVSKTEAELLGCKNFGVTSLNEIKDCLTKLGLSLRKLD